MKNHRHYIILITVALILSCSGGDPKKAPERNYYFEIKNYAKADYFEKLSAFLIEKIPQQKYTITNQSGLTWPYYAALELDESISIDSLMPPHTYVHKMMFKDLNTVLKTDDHLVHFDIMPKPDTIPNYRVDIYEMDSAGLTFTASSGIHYIDSTEFSSRQSLSDYILKSIIRYSFK